jgi:hypothetical protein
MSTECTRQFALNSAATAMNDADDLLRQIVMHFVTDAWADKRFIEDIIEVRKELQKCGDIARREANEIFNERRREQRRYDLPSLREIA